MRSFTIIYCIFFVGLSAKAQVSINTNGTAPSSTSMLDVQSTTRGVKFPRMTTAQRNAIAVTDADAGLMVYDLEQSALFMYDGLQWLPFATMSSALQMFRERKATGITSAAAMGKSVAISGEYAAAGCPNDTVNNITGKGSVVIFKKVNNNWIQHARLYSTELVREEFGYSVALSGDVLAVGAIYSKVGNIAQGAVYIYTRVGDAWVFQEKVFAPDGTGSNAFGASILLHQGSLYVGSPYHLSAKGSVYVFNYSANDWTYLTRLNASDGAASDLFGTSLAAHNNNIAIGAPDDDIATTNEGSAYVFIRNGNSFAQQGKLTLPGGLSNANLGKSVSIYDNTVVAGCPGGEISVGNIPGGIVGVFNRTGSTWDYEFMIRPYMSGDGYKRFGSSISLTGTDLIVGAPNEFVNSIDKKGAIYLYRLIKDNTEYHFRTRFFVGDQTPLTYTGFSLACDGASFIIGSPGSNPGFNGYVAAGSVLFGGL